MRHFYEPTDAGRPDARPARSEDAEVLALETIWRDKCCEFVRLAADGDAACWPLHDEIDKLEGYIDRILEVG